MLRHLVENHVDESYGQFRKQFKSAKQTDQEFDVHIAKMLINALFEPFDKKKTESTAKELTDAQKLNKPENGKTKEVVLEDKDPVLEKLSKMTQKYPLTQDFMQLTDVRCKAREMEDNARISCQLGLVFEKTVINPRDIFTCVHCDEEIGGGGELRNHLDVAHGDFVSNLSEMFPQAAKRMEQHIDKAATDFKFKKIAKKCPLTLDMMKLQDVRISAMKNYGGIAGRIGRQLNMVW